MKSYKTLSIFLMIALVACFLWCLKSCDETKSAISLHQASQDTLKLVRDSEGRMTGTIAVMEGSAKELITQIKSKDETIVRLQGLVKKYKGDLVSATTITITTIDTSKGKTIVKPGITVTINDTVYIYPVYSAYIRKTWAAYDLYMDKDSSSVISYIKNKIDFSQVYEGQGFLKKKKLVAKVTTLNPNTGIDAMHSFHVKEGKKHTGVKVGLGILFGIFLGAKL